MKRRNLVLLFIIIQGLVYSQGCLPEGITFYSQEEIDNFQTNYPDCTEIEGDVFIYSSNISNLDGFINLTSFGGNVSIINTVYLTNMMGLNNLSNISGILRLDSNHGLENLSGLENMVQMNGSIILHENASFESFIGLENLTLINGSMLVTSCNALVNFDGLNNLSSIGGSLRIAANDALNSLSGLENLQKIDGFLSVGSFSSPNNTPNCEGNSSLINMQGLNNLDTIGGDLCFYCNSSLQDLSGLESLKIINGNLSFGIYDWWPDTGNPNLHSLNGLDSLNYISGNLHVINCDNLEDISALSSVDSIGQSLLIKSNDTLTNLNGLQNIKPQSISSLYIIDNSSLSNCEAQSICEYITLPNAIIIIGYNAPGCNSPEQVEQACLVKTNEYNFMNDNIQIYPNPAQSTIKIINTRGIQINAISLFNQTGQKVLTIKSPNNSIDISDLKPGLYFAEIKTTEGSVMKKIIIQ